MTYTLIQINRSQHVFVTKWPFKLRFLSTRDPITDVFPCSVSLGDSSSLCESLQTSWPHLTSLTITDVSVCDVEATKILLTCLQPAGNQPSLDRVTWVSAWTSPPSLRPVYIYECLVPRAPYLVNFHLEINMHSATLKIRYKKSCKNKQKQKQRN